MENRDLILHFKRVQKLVLGKASFFPISFRKQHFPMVIKPLRTFIEYKN